MSVAAESSTNPFRNPPNRGQSHLSPQSTGMSNAPTAAPSFRTQDPNPPAVQVPEADGDALNEELPPAYTPGPDVFEGEQSIDFGPARPFQPPPRPPPQSMGYLSPNPTGYMSPQGTGRSGYAPPPMPPPQHPSRTGGSLSSSSGYLPPPGRPSTSNSQRPLSATSSSLYAPPPGAPLAASSSSPNPIYAPPPGLPPSRPAESSPSSSRATNDQNDGRPTTNPQPGHPLLRNGKVLVYPAGYTCHKCNNTGYKSFDPTHPCSKCWDRYSKPYEGALLYAPWNPSDRDARSNFQRPLPIFRAPPPLSSSASYAPPPPVPSPMGMGAAPWQSQPSLLSPGSRGMFGPSSPPVAYTNRPPPGALVVQPGDPRIGGTLCWRYVSFQIALYAD
ncbi:hypothetical protein SISSUDRAFT_1049288 [Sistotremastrum suecicum HHB10207 ss-3]|uniref:Uncharacterized protein n=1 Tax=Sistotremastrum suecicum HHB10207 ss-3 TaxID=1314776 RepID=A0A166BY56_9AGAM|nr:hypothetical protein SISSUDRAFT_1049288 [Sistotremastrum suecicum HHB10207 ss-3]